MFGQSLLSAFGSAACTTDTDQLFTTDVQTTSVATYQLNNATTSIPSNTYPGTPSNITYAAGKFGNAAVFNGSSSGITIPSIKSQLQSGASFTISCWVNVSSSQSGEGMIINTAASSGTQGVNIGIRPSTGLVYFQIRGNNNLNASGTTNLIGAGWKNIVLTHTNSSTILYVNGTQEASIGANTLGTIPNDLTLGKWANLSLYYLNGSIDQVRIFNTALPQSAVTALYNETTTTATSASVDYVVANPNSIAYYKMSDATDQLGNYNGTATNVNFNTEGKFGFAGAFNGSSSKIDLPSTIANSIKANNSFTVSAWFNTSTTGTRQTFFSSFDGTYIMLEVTTGNQLKGTVSNSVGTNTELTVSTTVTDGVWHHALFTGENGDLRLYLDNGTPQTSTSWNGTFFNGGGGTDIGSRFGNDYFNGKIDQVRIYDSVLSADNVTALYNEIECPAVAVTNAFNTVIYTGNSGTQQISTVGFQPDMVWTKQRSSPSRDHLLNDSVRGANKILYPNLSNAEDTAGGSGSAYFNSFDSNGYTVGSSNYYNGSSLDYVSWNFKAGGNSNTFNVDGIGYSSASAAGLATGTNNPTGASVNTVSGFSIIKLNSGSVANSDRTVAHGLGVKPSFVLFRRTSQSAWFTWSAGLSPESYYLYLQDSYGVGGLTQSGNAWGNQSFTDTTISWRNSWTFSPNEELIAYVWADISGYQKSGSYIGNDTTNTIYVGFKPRFLLIKCSSNGGTNKEWVMIDSTMDPSTPITKRLEANTSDAEATDTINVTMNNDGWTMPNGTSTASINQIGFSYVFLAIA